MNKIQEFNELHFSEELLFLGNAWDLHSAFTLEKAGFKAIGTTSWGIANSLGYADGELIDFDRHLEIIRTITENKNSYSEYDYLGIENGLSRQTVEIETL